MLKILSWNIRQGGGSRCQLIIKAIQKMDAEIVVLSEYRNNDKGQYLRNALLRLGYYHHLVSDSKPQVNGVLIVSRIAFNGLRFPSSDPIYNYSVLRAEFSPFDLYGCYLPHKKKHQLIPFVQEEIKRRQRPAIIVGDLNTGINEQDQKGNSFWYQDELQDLFESGITDAFRLKQGDVREYSWYSHQGNGYRYDHSFVSKSLEPLISSCAYEHLYREQKYSDHSPMILKLGT